MRRLKLTLILLLITCLNLGCATVTLPELADHERCVVSIEHDKCRCHLYRVSAKEVGRVSDSYDKPLPYCDKLIGFSPDTWVEYVLWFEEAFQAAEDANAALIIKPQIETPGDIIMLSHDN